MLKLLKLTAVILGCSCYGHSQWLGAWDVGSGKFTKLSSIQVKSSTDNLSFDRNPITGHILCKSDDSIWIISPNSPFEVLQAYSCESEFIWPELCRFVPNLNAIISLAFKSKENGDLVSEGTANIIQLDRANPFQSTAVGKLGFTIAMLRNGDIVEAVGSTINLHKKSNTNTWNLATSFKITNEKIYTIKDLGDNYHFAFWTNSKFFVVDIRDESICLTLDRSEKLYDSWAAGPRISPSTDELAISEKDKTGKFTLSIYKLHSPNNKPSLQINLDHAWPSGMEYSPSGKFITISPGEGTDALIYNRSTGMLHKKLRLPKNISEENSQHPAIVYSADGNLIYVVFINPGC
jgi:hypothetical protein